MDGWMGVTKINENMNFSIKVVIWRSIEMLVGIIVVVRGGGKVTSKPYNQPTGSLYTT